jgi:PAS domain S-box-containing protein
LDYTPKILIVDDLEVNLLTLEGNLRRLNAQIFRAQSGQEALIRIQQHDFALIIIDIQMPEMNGYEVAEHIRQGRRNQFTPIIFLTAVYFDQLSVYKGYRTGAVDYITKPFNFEILTSKVKVFLDLDRIKHELIDSRKQFRDVVQDQIDLICRTDASHNILFANQSMATALGVNEEQITGQPITRWMTDDDKRKVEQVLSGLNPTKPLAEVLHVLQPSATCQLSVSSIVRALFNDDYELIGYQWVIRDITAEIKAREQLLIAKQKAEEATRYKSLFLASMSHETRNPLNSILGMIDLLKETNLSDNQRESIEILEFSAGKLHKLLNDMLDLSRIESNKVKIEPTLFNLHEELKKLVKSYQVQAGQQNSKLLLNIHPEVPARIVSDPLRLSQIISNLLINALKFTKNGSVELSVSRETGTKNMVQLKFMITDNGVGIDANENVNIFDEFTQGDDPVARTYGGSGLGLSISARLCELMGGKLDYTSLPGKETSFWFSLQFEYQDEQKENDSNSPRFLIVEDNLLNQQVVAAILKRHGYTFDVAVNGLVALEKVKQTFYDIILMDIQMPEMDGYEATIKIREFEKENGFERKSQILALTANATNEDRIKCLNLGMDDYFIKPFKFEDLEDVISNL